MMMNGHIWKWKMEYWQLKRSQRGNSWRGLGKSRRVLRFINEGFKIQDEAFAKAEAAAASTLLEALGPLCRAQVSTLIETLPTS